MGGRTGRGEGHNILGDGEELGEGRGINLMATVLSEQECFKKMRKSGSAVSFQKQVSH